MRGTTATGGTTGTTAIATGGGARMAVGVGAVEAGEVEEGGDEAGVPEGMGRRGESFSWV